MLLKYVGEFNMHRRYIPLNAPLDLNTLSKYKDSHQQLYDMIKIIWKQKF